MGNRVCKTVSITFGAEGSGYDLNEDGLHIRVGLPDLGDEPSALSFEGAFTVIEATDTGFVASSDRTGLRFGFLKAKLGGRLEAQVAALYGALLEKNTRHHLLRIWNIIPRIHDLEAGEPRYWIFNRARREAFRRHFGGPDWQTKLPAASGVGGDSRQPVCLFFLACDAPPRHYENPRQVPAYDYPGRYGPAGPAFARASAASTCGPAHPPVFVSGTAAVVGHESVGSRDLDTQLEATRENLAALSESLGFDGLLQPAAPTRRIFVVYLRRREHLDKVRTFVRTRLAAEHDRVVFLLAEICRQELEVEIEATLLPADGGEVLTARSPV